MKHTAYICVIALAVLAMASVFSPAASQEKTPVSPASPASPASPVSPVSPAVEAVSFTLIISGTRHYQDIEVIARNISRLPLMQRLAPSVSSQNHVQFMGLFGGQQEALLADLRGLAADRYEVQSRNDDARGLLITLRKIQQEP